MEPLVAHADVNADTITTANPSGLGDLGNLKRSTRSSTNLVFADSRLSSFDALK
jgi:hypothetical protein